MSRFSKSLGKIEIKGKIPCSNPFKFWRHETYNMLFENPRCPIICLGMWSSYILWAQDIQFQN
jgi:hypothetical protein